MIVNSKIPEAPDTVVVATMTRSSATKAKHVTGSPTSTPAGSVQVNVPGSTPTSMARNVPKLHSASCRSNDVSAPGGSVSGGTSGATAATNDAPVIAAQSPAETDATDLNTARMVLNARAQLPCGSQV